MAARTRRHFYTCPHCWDRGSVVVDLSSEGRERFFEDCRVCGNSVEFTVDVEDGKVTGVGAEMPGARRFGVVRHHAPVAC